MRRHKGFLLMIGCLCATHSYAEPLPAERGWWFYGLPAPLKKIQVIQHNPVNPVFKATQKKDACQSPNTWQSSCGFISPKTYAFEQKEYHALIQSYAMHPNDRHAVYQFQRFSDWALQHAITASYTWQYNIVQHPELDETIYTPFSQFGNQFVSRLNDKREASFFQLLSKTSLLVFFSRTDCEMCHREAELVQRLSRKTGLPLWNASLDTAAIPGFQHVMTAPETFAPARTLHVSITPTVFIYLKPNAAGVGAKWIRIGTGLVSVEAFRTRIIHFVEAYRHAIVVGVAEGQQQKVPNFKILRSNLLATEHQAISKEE